MAKARETERSARSKDFIITANMKVWRMVTVEALLLELPELRR